MKKAILICLFLPLTMLFIASGTIAQTQRTSKSVSQKLKIENDGDTLFHFDGFYYSVTNQDFDDFEMVFADYDSLTPAPNNTVPNSEWNFYYDVLSEGDTLNWVEATSWFEPSGQADDWITLGPLTVPDAGATFSWRAFHNPVFRNGYEVKISTDGMEPEDFSSEPLFVVEDLMEQSSENIDTNRQFQDPPKSFTLPDSVSGQQVYIAIHHNSTDMDVLHLSDFVLKSHTTSIPETIAFNKLKAYPNPARDGFTLQFELSSASEVVFELSALSGKVIRRENTDGKVGVNQIYTDVSGLSPGLYFYRLQGRNAGITKKIVIY
ncbi:MAG: T9SS type A sorting domain-containing protein [Bacteroidota bacterium]